MWLLLFGLLSAAAPGLDCLRLDKVVVPSHVERGDDFDLTCLYDMEEDELYVVKWYKDGGEFYRFEPEVRPKKKKFPQQGVKVDLWASNDTHVHLRDAAFRYDGVYECEVTAEAPRFTTVEGGGRLQVVEFPIDGPVITGARARYEVGDLVKVNCTARKSRPAARITWYINDQQAESELLQLWPPTVHEDGLQSVAVGLRFRARSEHFGRGRLQLRCVCQMGGRLRPLYWKSKERSVLGGRRPQEDTGLHGGTAANRTAASRTPEVASGRDGASTSRSGTCWTKPPPEVAGVLERASTSKSGSDCLLVCRVVARWVMVVVSALLAR